MKQFDKRNLTMVMDFYELTMSNGYFREQDRDARVAFDVFYRKNPDGGGYSIFAGLEQIIEYIQDLHLMTMTLHICVSRRSSRRIFWNIYGISNLREICMHFRRGRSCTRMNRF